MLLAYLVAMFGDSSELPKLYGPEYFPTAEAAEQQRLSDVAAIEAKKRELRERKERNG